MDDVKNTMNAEEKIRELVQERSGSYNDPVASVMVMMASAMYENTEKKWHLARIISICEQEAGEGFRADPRRSFIDVTLEEVGRLVLQRYWDAAADKAARLLLTILEAEEPPAWRRAIDNEIESYFDVRSGLTGVLCNLGFLNQAVAGPDTTSVPVYLARIAANCETAVGDGWRAEPYPPGHDATLDCLLSHVGTSPGCLRVTGNCAATWLAKGLQS